jgi:hypothetical protein
MLKQAFVQVSQISVGVPRRGHPFVDLYQMHVGPWDFALGQVTQHDPWGVAATDGHDKASALSNGHPSVCGNDCGSLSSDRIRICKYFNLHENISNLD